MKIKKEIQNFRLKGNDSRLVSLPVDLDENGKIVKVYDYNGKELLLFKDARMILWNGKQYCY